MAETVKNGTEGTPLPVVSEAEGAPKEPAQATASATSPTNGSTVPSNPPSDAKKDKPKVGADTVFTGDLLRQVRESQRITLKEIAERTRISVANLAALENEKYEDLPNARVYVRGFVRCLAVEIGLDRDQVSRTYLPRWEAWFAARDDRLR